MILPSTLRGIGQNAFSDCFRLAEVINHSSLGITAGEDTYGHVGYYALLVHNGVSRILMIEDYYFLVDESYRYYLLAYAGKDTELTLPNGFSYAVHDWAFAYRSDVISVAMPASVTEIGAYAFFGCTALETVVLPTELKCIADHTFDGCRTLSGLTLPNTIEKIGSFAFADCRQLTAITLPKTVSEIGSYAFYNCRALGFFAFDGAVSVWDRVERGAYWNFRMAANQVKLRSGYAHLEA